MRSLPIDYCGWNQDNVQAISSNFCKLLDVEKIKSITEIQDALSPGDAAALEGLFDHLLKSGKEFNLSVTTEDNTKVIKLHGQRGALPGTDEVFHVIWAYDITSFAQAAVGNAEAMAEAEEKEHEFKNTLNSLSVPIWIRDEDLKICWCNKAYSKFMDESLATIVAENKELPTISINKEKGETEKGSRILAQRALAKKEPQSENRHLVIEGKRRLMQIIETPDMDTGNVIGFAYDISRVEEAEYEIRQHIQTNKEALEQMGTAIAIYDTETGLEFYNTAFGQLWGLDENWLNKKPKIAQILEKLRENRKLPEQADFKKFKHKWQDYFTSLMEPYEEMQYLPDGKVLRMVIVPRHQGGLLITYEDVTSRIELETSYNTLIAVQKETLDNLSEGLAVFGEDGRLKLWNPTFSSIWDIPPEQLEGTPHISSIIDKMEEFFSKKNWEEQKKVLIRNGLERTPRKGRIQRADNTVLEYAIIPLPDGNVLNAYFDITDTVKVEEALMEKNMALEEAERLKLDFLANVSYQLRTPLNAIMGFSEILNEQYFGKLNEKQLEYTGGMIEAGQRLVSLVNDILDLSTIEAGYLSLYPVDIVVKDVVENVVELTEEWARNQGVMIKVRCPKKIGNIIADERRFKQVLLNLISNAINFSMEGGNIDIKVSREDESVTILVKDSGIGIAQEDIEKVFSPFEKSSTAEGKKRHSGAGLGLSLVKNIVELHGGFISLESEEGKGTEVSCTFPLTAEIKESDPKEEEGLVIRAS